jgi:hypothetical protein
MAELVTIYFISSTDNTNIKIGRSKNVKERLSSLQVASSAKLQVEYVIENMDPSFEQHIHSLVSRYNVSGEWFTQEALTHLLKHPWFKEHIEPVRRTA